jgi:seryl-tRNA(Sec) selenium transferase
VALGGEPDPLERRLRAGRIPVIARVADGRLLVELRSVPATQDGALGTALADTLSADG